MKIVVAMDSFKQTISSELANETVKNAILDVDQNIDVNTFTLTNGKEGTLSTLSKALKAETIYVKVNDPLMRIISAAYNHVKVQNLAIIEITQTAGLDLVEQHLQNPFIASTFGVGQLILDALDRGCTQFIIGLGTTATSDCGIGMLQALGFRFLDINNQVINGVGMEQLNLFSIDDSNVDQRLYKCRFKIACDVENPLFGPNGAASVYGPHKGATQHMITLLDTVAEHFSKCIRAYNNTNHAYLMGSGAAGGLAFAFVSFFHAELLSSVDLMLQTLNLESNISNADLVITGEGKLDLFTTKSRSPLGIARLAKKHNTPVIALAGIMADNNIQHNFDQLDAYFSILYSPIMSTETTQEAISCDNLYLIAQQIIQLLLLKVVV